MKKGNCAAFAQFPFCNSPGISISEARFLSILHTPHFLVFKRCVACQSLEGFGEIGRVGKAARLGNLVYTFRADLEHTASQLESVGNNVLVKGLSLLILQKLTDIEGVVAEYCSKLGI